MPTISFNDVIDIYDTWLSLPHLPQNYLDDTIDLRDSLVADIAGATTRVINIDDDIDLTDSFSYLTVGAGGYVVNKNVNFDLTDTFIYETYGGAFVRLINMIYDLTDTFESTVIINIVSESNLIYNRNISFGETKEPGYKEYSHRFRWTNYNGIAVPDLNYKDLKEPIVRIMPAPSFLQFEYANSFLLFTRNTINRFILTPDVETGQWRARTDNLIEEFKDLGLMAPKTLVLAGDTLFGLSEKGVWKWNKEGMDLISDKIIDLPDAGVHEYIAFYSSIRNQYILHRQESSGSVYQMTKGTAVALPDFTGDNISSWDPYIVMITDTKFVHLAWYDSNTSFFVVGTVDTIGRSVSFGAAVVGLGTVIANHSMIKMSETRLLYTSDTSGQPRKMRVVKITGTVPVLVGSIDVSSGSYDGGYLVRFSNTRFAIFHNQTDYYTGTFDGDELITLDTVQYNWSTTIQNMKTLPISDGKALIMYAISGGNVKCQIIEDNGDGTMNFGSALDTGIAYTSGDQFDVVMPQDDTFFTVVSNNQDLVILPLSLSGTTLSAGTLETKTDWCDTPAGIRGVSIANKGASGFWLFYEDDLNSGRLTAVWGTGSPTKMSLLDDTKEVINANQSEYISSAVVPGGFAVMTYMDGNVMAVEGYAMVWGMKTAGIDSYVYQIDRDKWGKFLGIDILDIPVILSGGSLDENYNLWLDSDRELKKYPGTAYTAVEAMIRTKEFYIEKGAFQRWMVDFEGSDVNVETRVRRMVSGSKVDKEDIKYNIAPNKWRGISLDKQRGYEMSIKIIDADIIKGLSFDSKKWGEN